jgi:hypothetical protein
MTTANPKGNITVIASADLAAQQFRAVTNAGAVCANGAKALGILQNNPASGQAATVCTEHLSKAVAGGNIAKDADLMSNGSGALVTATGASVWVVARAMEAAAAGDIFQVLVTTTSGKQLPA